MNGRLESATPIKGQTLYLDTSAVLPLALVRAGTSASWDQRRAARLKAFCGKLSAQGGTAVCSILTFEEIAAKARNDSLWLAINQNGARNFREFEQADPTAAAAAQDQARDDAVNMLGFALDGLTEIAGVLKQPWCRETDAASEGEKVRKTHRNLLKKYPGLDSMDALHVTFGLMLGCTHFASFDNSWLDVSEINVVH